MKPRGTGAGAGFGLAAACGLALLAAAPALAGDARILTRAYRPSEVVRIEGKLGVQATIAFGEAEKGGEKIENVAVGDADRWQITPNKRADLLFVKPLEPAARTNMTVVTDKRTYLFDLVASPTGNPVYMLSFTYGGPMEPAPGDANPAAARPAGASFGDIMREGLAESASQAAAGKGIDPAMLNFAWLAKGAEKLAPLRIYDDGAHTYMLWSTRQGTPEIRVRNPQGEESAAITAKRGNTIVVDGVPAAIVLVDGKLRAVIENRNLPAPAPASTGASTSESRAPAQAAAGAPAELAASPQGN